MPDVAFKDLCLDTTVPDLAAPFWATMLGLDAGRQDSGDYRLSSPVPERTIWVNTVPEPVSVKNRIHLDVRLPERPDATLIREDEHWTVLADPEGLQFCWFPRHGDDATGLFEICVDAADALAMATWWAARTGATVHVEDGGWVWLDGVAGYPYDAWVFNPVPEPKTVKNRMHWDVTLVDATVESLVADGATVLRERDDEIGWTVMADPEGNEFCAFDAS
jgi:hypothetical protein